MEQLERAKLVEIDDYSLDPGPPAEGKKVVEVDFNPESLKINLSNQSSGGDQQAGGSTQFLGPGSSSLSMELVFDTSASGTDVRLRTEALAYFIVGDAQREGESRMAPPKVSFRWGRFLFEGIIESMDETLEYFSEQGVPLRATVSISLKRDALVFYNEEHLGQRINEPNQGMGGITPLSQAQSGDSVQSMAGRSGYSANWKSIAAANDIDDPLRLEAGAMINLNANVKI
jgi:hypothetical protein